MVSLFQIDVVNHLSDLSDEFKDDEDFSIGRKIFQYLDNMDFTEIDACCNSSDCNSSKFKPAIRLQNVVGFEERHNDLLYSPPLAGEVHDVKLGSSHHGIVVFFGGDMQDFHDNMINKENTKTFASWSLENVAKLLCMHYRNCHIIVVRPSSIEEGIFSKYSNFVPSSKYGEPHFTPNYGSLVHLGKLLTNLQEMLRNMDQTDLKKRLEDTCRSLECKSCCIPAEDEFKKDFSNCHIELVAFSKGCVVLNQFLHEFHHFEHENLTESKEVIDLIDRIKTIRWLDGGHGGRHGTWITSQEVLSSYAKLGKQTFVHVTPYQVLCSKRPWIGKEESIFTRTLTEGKVEIKRILHMEHSKGTLEDHFKLLKEVFSNIQ